MTPRRDGARSRRLGWWATLGAGAVVGCGQSAPPAPTPADQLRGTRLVVGVVGDPALLRSVATQRGEWVAQTNSELTVRDVAVDPRSIPADVDVLVFAGERLGDLVDAQVLLALPESLVAPPAAAATDGDSPASGKQPTEVADPLRFAEVAPGFRDQVSRYGPLRYGLPIGGSGLVLAFHRSAFTNPALVEAARAAGVTLAPPRLWTDLDALARFLNGRDIDGDGQADHGLAVAWGADPEGVGDATLLARVAGLALHPDQFSFLLDSETTEPRVTSPPFVEALQAMVDLKAAGPPGCEKFDAPAARAAFKAGRAAMLIDRAEAASTWGTGRDPIGVAPLPGSARVFDPSRAAWDHPSVPNQPSYLPSGGGWLVGIAAKTTHRPAAEGFARYLASPETTDRLRAERAFPMLAVRTPQLVQGMANPRSSPGVETRPWADAVARTLTAEKVVPGLRIPGATGYLADLTAARVAAVEGAPVPDALARLAEAWTARTKSLGAARQTWHHRRSLNGPTTASEPPPR